MIMASCTIAYTRVILSGYTYLLAPMNQLSSAVLHSVAPVAGAAPSAEVTRLWDAVFKCSAVVIVHAAKYGFSGMEKLDPNIHDIVLYIGMAEGAIDVLANDKDAEYEDVRLLLNSKKQMTTLKMVARALSQGDVEGFEAAMRDLENQAAF